jgi:hypothetical protein
LAAINADEHDTGVRFDLLLDIVLVGVGLLALLGAPIVLGKQDQICLLAADRYFAAAHRIPRWLPHPWYAASTSRQFISAIRVLAWTARAGALAMSLSGAALILVGADAIE